MERRKALTVQEALDVIEDGDFDSDDPSPVDLVILPPPTVDQVTDEEDCNEDIVGGENSVRDVAGEVEAHLPTSAQPPPPKTKRRKIEQEARWSKKTPEYTKMPPPTEGVKPREDSLQDLLGDKSPLQLFEELFTEEIFDHIIIETLRYAKDTKNDQLFSLPLGDLKTFIGILLLSGYNKLPSERHYWSGAGDLGVDDVKEAMARNRYDSIKANIHFRDNKDAGANQHDRAFKIRPLIDMLNRTFQKFGIFREDLAIDEMMVKYFGRNSLKQFHQREPR